jgi:hypothetical protein
VRGTCSWGRKRERRGKQPVGGGHWQDWLGLEVVWHTERPKIPGWVVMTVAWIRFKHAAHKMSR